MTSYNIINEVRASENAELLRGILREEWGYQGLIMTDWGNYADKTAEILAGNDIRMPYIEEKQMPKCLDFIKKHNVRSELALSVKQLLKLILWLE